jgi:ubiquinone/menaquinone biosynthesis C-methylase UbiE/uncharacterized protein YbaR (Trm112 family)
MMDFVCPDCKKKLDVEQYAYKCKPCNQVYPLVNGLPCFKKDAFCWGEEKEELKTIIKDALNRGWHKALDEAFKVDKPVFLTGILDDSRADFSYVLPIDKDAVVLDLGSGWGTISIALARQYKHIYAVDAYYELAKLLQIRKGEAKLENITSLCADGFKLPFPDNYFDCVVLYGVLEWAGFVLKQERPQTAQLKLLQEVNRVLKNGGCAYVSIENRWGLIYFLGLPDPHTNLPFITIMPRFLANIYHKLMRRGNYNILTHSLNGYRQLFTAADFAKIKFFTPLPSYRKFYYLVPLDNQEVMEYFINNLARAQTWLSRLFLSPVRLFKLNRLVKYLVSDYAIIAEKKVS